jgi:hypothetical protein
MIPQRGASSRLVRKICEANQAGSFPKASAVLWDLAGLRISPKRVQWTTECVGAVLAQERDELTEEFFRHGCTPAAPSPQQPIQLLVVSADGGRVQTRQDDPDQKWKEDKVGIVYDAVPCPEQAGQPYKGPAPLTKSVVGTMHPWGRLGDHLSAVADRRGHTRARQVVFVSDGAQAIRTVRERCFPDAAFVLDWKHATDNLRQASTIALGLGPQAERWYEKQKQRLWEGRTDLFLRHLGGLARRLRRPGTGGTDSDRARMLANVQSYFRTNRAGLDYPQFRQRGWPLASAQTESTIKQVGKRVKGSEKHWSLDGVEQTLQVTTHLVANDGTWDSFWRRHAWANRN